MNSDDFPVRPLLSPSAVGGLIAGILIFAATLILPPPAGLPLEGWRTLGLALLMAVWWTTEPVPIGITSLMPVIVMPLLGIGDIGTAAAPLRTRSYSCFSAAFSWLPLSRNGVYIGGSLTRRCAPWALGRGASSWAS